MSDGKVCLSREERRDLCGSPFKEKQYAFLRQNGIRHYKGLDGWPRVLRSTIEGTGHSEKDEAVDTWKPNKAA